MSKTDFNEEGLYASTEDYKDENIWLMLGDCLERMNEIPNGSVDAIICAI